MLNPVIQNPADDAKTKVVGLFNRERDLTAKRAEKLAALDAAEAHASLALADGAESLESLVESLDRDKRDVRLLEQSIDLIRQQRRAAIKQSFATEAASLRAVAQQRKSELDALAKQSDQLLAKLSTLQGCSFMPAALTSGWQAGQSFPRPRTELLAAEVAALESRARELEAREVPDAGVVQFKISVGALLASEELVDPFAIAPTTHSILVWLAAVEARVPVEQRQLPRRYRLAWQNGEIVAGDSSVSLHGPNSVYTDLSFTAEVPAR